jgi:hypothetical protein
MDGFIDSIFETGQPVVYEAYSEYGQKIKSFLSSHELRIHIKLLIRNGEKFLHYAIYYPESKGYVEEERINLDPKKCKGATFRYAINGWGIIYFQCDYKNQPNLECRIAVNSSKRAEKWSGTYPNFKTPSLWDWKIVESNAKRLTKNLKKMSK